MDTVLAALFTHIERLSDQELQSLDAEDVPWLPRLGVLPREIAIREIRRVLEGTYSVPQCLERIAWLHCWLMPRNKIESWMLYRLGRSVLQADYPTLLRRLTRRLPLPGYRTMLRVNHSEGTYYACMINSGPYLRARDHEVVCLVLWRGQCFMAAHAARTDVAHRLAVALHRVLGGDVVELLQGDYRDPVSTFSVARLNAAFRARYY